MARLDELTEKDRNEMAKKALLRENRLLKLIDGCSTVLCKLGKVTYRDVHNWFTEETSEFNGLGFYIKDHGPNTMYGGDSLEITYDGEKVLDVYYWSTAPSDPSYEVRHYAEGKWEGELENLIKNVNEEAKKKAKADRLRAAEEEKERRDRELLEEANRSLEKRLKNLGPYI